MKRPNIIYIHTHDSGRLTSAYGHGFKADNMKEFAKDALLFQKAFCTNPTCSPSRASLLTGLYPHENGMLGLANRGFTLNDYSQHLTTTLNSLDYETVLCGIQHLVSRYTDHDAGAKTIGYKTNLTSDNEGMSEQELVEWDKTNAQNISKWLDKKTDEQPFFLSYGMFSTHREFPEISPKNINPNYIDVPNGLVNNFDTRSDYSEYLETLIIADQCFGQVIDSLKRNGFYDNSIIILTTDHGVAFPFSKCNLTDNGIGVQLIMKTPNMKKKGVVSESLVSQVDIFPTLCDLLDIDYPHQMSGESFAHLFNDEKLKHRDYVFATVNFHTSYEPIRAVRSERYKYVKYFDSYDRANLSNIDTSITKDWYIDHGLKERQKEMEGFYDLYYDVDEKNNLINSKQHQEIIKTHKQKLQEFMEKTNDPLLQGKIKIKDSWKVNKPTAVEASSKNPLDYE